MPDKKYVAVASSGEWAPARPEPAGIGVMLPEFLSVEVTSSGGGRDHFKVLEGLYAGRTFSMSAAHLRPGNPGYRGPAHLHFNIGKQRLNFPGGQVRATTGAHVPIAPGSYPVHIPDVPHDSGAARPGAPQCAATWFYLGRGVPNPGSDESYLNTGATSDGGITVELSDWPALHRYLMLCRSGDARTVGAVDVVLR
ncbi:MAG: hypothetical protein JWO70_2644 [Betaproteobacteria bacterium]|nr:hypothetical protein [Betaproteobacteria bacterium]